MEIRAAKTSYKTGRLLKDLLNDVKGDCVISYGVPLSTHLPGLNLTASKLNKYEELCRIAQKGIPALKTALRGSEEVENLTLPLFGRKFKHTKGKDIITIFEKDELKYRPCDFYTEYLPNIAEYRVWVFRDKALATYKKVMRYPERFTKVGKGYENGYAFEFVEAPKGIRPIAKDAVASLDYDFGAVDILEAKDGSFVVCEVNSAPSQDGPRTGITRLAEEIKKWVATGYPERGEWNTKSPKPSASYRPYPEPYMRPTQSWPNPPIRETQPPLSYVMPKPGYSWSTELRDALSTKLKPTQD